MTAEQVKLVRLCEGMGADKGQAEAMAAQLLKRADQLSRERAISRTEALEYLLKVLVSGHRGEVYRGEESSEAGKTGKNSRNPHNKAD